MKNCIVKLYRLEKSENITNYSEVGQYRAMIIQLDESVAPLYPDVQIDKAYRCFINMEVKVNAGDKIVVYDKELSGLENNDSFIAYQKFTKVKILGSFLNSGVIIKE